MDLKIFKQKFFADLPTIAEAFLAVAALSFIACYTCAEVWGKFSYFFEALFFALFYIMCVLDLLAGAILMTVLNLKQKKGELVLSDTKFLNVGAKKTYILADNWYISFLWLWLFALLAPFVFFPLGLQPAAIISGYLLDLTILFGIFVNARATYLSIQQVKTEKKAES